MSIVPKIDPVVADVIAQLADKGHETYVVGGAVRDLLQGIEPKDYDVATAAHPEQVREVFGRRKSRIIGRRFRLVHVYTAKGVVEVSTFRREPTSEERRERTDDDGVVLWRDNQYGSLEQDAHRRDFTVNALYCDPVGDKGIIDLVGGVEDLRAGVVRCVGAPDERLEEDPVRILRALKLVGLYGFELEENLGVAIRTKGDTIRLASKARLFEELLKILASPKSADILQAFHDHGFLTHFWPGLETRWDTAAGRLTQDLLRERGARIRAGNCSTSKALALATVCLPAVAEGLRSPESDWLWEHQEGLERDCRQALRTFFRPFPVSRFLSAKARDIVLLLPRLREGRRRRRVIKHPEYKYGRALFDLLVTVQEWDRDWVTQWPPPPKREEPVDDRRSRRPRRGRSGRRRARRE